jgi:hypothetical protein
VSCLSFPLSPSRNGGEQKLGTNEKLREGNRNIKRFYTVFNCLKGFVVIVVVTFAMAGGSNRASQTLHTGLFL